MITIREPNRTSVASLGVQHEEVGRSYKYSNYLIREGNAIYNSLTDEIVFVQDEKLDRKELIRRWFLVPEDFSVLTASDIIRQSYLGKQSGPGRNLKTNYVIFTTTACNGNCEYCFEKNYKTISMTESVAENVANYIIRSHAPRTKVSIKWFGGEPLVNKDAINLITSRISDKVDFKSTMCSNGDLLSDCTDDEFKLWRLKSVQLTLDDVGDAYDKIKGLKSGAYARLKETVSRLNDLGITSQLRIHFNPDKGIEPCLKIVDEFKSFKNVQMYSRILYDSATIKDYEALLTIEQAINDSKNRTFKIPKMEIGSHCMGDNRHVACITPEGLLSPCEHYAYGEHIYGSIYNKNRNEDILKKWSVREKYVTPSCKECPLYPSCRKLVMCPAEGKCSEGYQYYQIETIKRALRKKVEEINGRDSNTNN